MHKKEDLSSKEKRLYGLTKKRQHYKERHYGYNCFHRWRDNYDRKANTQIILLTIASILLGITVIAIAGITIPNGWIVWGIFCVVILAVIFLALNMKKYVYHHDISKMVKYGENILALAESIYTLTSTMAISKELYNDIFSDFVNYYSQDKDELKKICAEMYSNSSQLGSS